MTTYENAIDEMFSLFMSAWNSGSGDVVGYTPEIRWQGVEEPSVPSTKLHFVRVSQKTAIDSQSSFRNGDFNKCYTNNGNVFVQIFAPRSESTAMEAGRRLAVVARNAFRGKKTASGVWFRNVTIKELDPEDSFYRFNVIADYEYDENY